MDHLKGKETEQCVSSVEKVFKDNPSYTISSLSDVHCKYWCYIYKNVYEKQNTLWKCTKILQQCSLFTAATKNLQQKYAEKQLIVKNLHQNWVCFLHFKEGVLQKQTEQLVL
jgi:hypothetical protein